MSERITKTASQLVVGDVVEDQGELIAITWTTPGGVVAEWDDGYEAYYPSDYKFCVFRGGKELK